MQLKVILSETSFYSEKYDVAQLKSFEMNLRRKVSERYSGNNMTRGLARVSRGLCKSVQTLPTHNTCHGDGRCFRRPRPHSLDIDNLDPGGAGGVISHSIVPCHRVTVRSCDEPYEEFRRAGIGACFKGKPIVEDNS